MKKNFERIKEEKLYVDAETNKFKSSISELEEKLSVANSKIIELEKSSERIEALENEKNDLKAELEQKNNEIESLKKDLQKSISDKYVEVESLKDEKESKVKEAEALNDKIKALEETISEAKGAPQLMDDIKDILMQKGFLSDKEFEDLLERTSLE